MPRVPGYYFDGKGRKAERHARIRKAELERLAERQAEQRGERNWLVVDLDTGISFDAFATQAEADERAKFMTECHQRAYGVRERK